MIQNTNPADATATAAVNLASYVSANWEKIVLSATIVLLSFVMIRALRLLMTRLGKEYDLPPKSVRLLNTIITYSVAIFAVAGLLSVFNVQLYSLIMSLGIISVVVVLGSQLIISNLLGGTVVYIEKPFMVGDLIKIGNDLGVVQNISFRSTVLKSNTGLIITVPNSTFLTTSIVNYTRTQGYLVDVPFVMPVETDVSGLIESIHQNRGSIPGFNSDHPEALFKTGISEKEIQYRLHFWVSDPGRADDARSKVIDIIGRCYRQRSHRDSA